MITILQKYTQYPAFKQTVALFSLTMFLFWPTIVSMWETWTFDSNNSHGILVPVIGLYLLNLRLRDEKSKKKMAEKSQEKLWNPSFLLGLIGLLGSIFLYFIGFTTGILIFQRFAFVTMLISAIIFVFGWNVFDALRFPLLFLYFMVPVPASIYGKVALPLQLLTTKASVFFLKFTNLPVWSEGNIIHVGPEVLEVAEACSGLRSLISFIMISALFAYLAKARMWQKISILFLSVPVAVIGNIIRIIFTTFIAYIYGTRVAAGFIHDISGYVMFVLAFAIFLWISRKIEGWNRAK